MPAPPAVDAAVADAAVAAADAVARVLDGARMPALVVSDLDLDLALDPSDATVVRVGAAKPDEHFRTVVLAVPDVEALRAAAGRVAGVGWARMVGVVVADTTAALTLRPHPAWPALVDVDATRAATRLEFAERLDAGPVLGAFARAAGRTVGGHGGLRVALPGTISDDPEAQHPPDLLVDPPSAPVVSNVTGRAPTVVTAAEAGEPLDEAVYRPVGFRRDWDRGVVDLPAGTVLSPTLVRELRDAQGARLAPGHDQRLADGLAMSGVPLLGGARSDALGAGEVDLDDALRREELSVRLRRAALAEQASPSWRARLAQRAGARATGYPSVSVLLPTRRPDLLAHALAQVGRQRRSLPGAEVELVLAAHGFTPDPDVVAAASELGGVPTTIVEATTDTSFGQLLRLATDAASGDVVLKMDDDDWYGPDVVTDLLLAHRYSGAELVGMPAELVYLEQVDTTVRRKGPSEAYGSVVAGGTMLLSRTLLRELGGWRPAPRFVDAHVLDAVRRAGGSVYRTHGLGYVLRRSATGHTWDPGLDYFLRPETLLDRWDGFRPSRLLGDA